MKWGEALSGYVFFPNGSSTLCIHENDPILCDVLVGRGRYDEAIAAIDKLLVGNPVDASLHLKRAVALIWLGKFDEAVESLSRSLKLREDHDAYWQRAMAYLLLGKYKEAWPDFEHRTLRSNYETLHFGLDPALRWKLGEPIDGKTVLVHYEGQGFGDTIQFMRFLPELLSRGAKKLFLVVRRELHPLLTGIPNTTLVTRGNDLDFDCWAPLLSLPYLLDIDEMTLPKPYLPVLKRRCTTTWPGSFHIGVNWSGNWRQKIDKLRSIPLSVFAALFDVPAQFVSVQQVRPSLKSATPILPLSISRN